MSSAASARRALVEPPTCRHDIPGGPFPGVQSAASGPPRWRPTRTTTPSRSWSAHYRALRGEHPDWAEFCAAMVADRRLVIRLPVDRMYGWAPEEP